jgi:hypothetical protein
MSPTEINEVKREYCLELIFEYINKRLLTTEKDNTCLIYLFSLSSQLGMPQQTLMEYLEEVIASYIDLGWRVKHANDAKNVGGTLEFFENEIKVD